MKISDFGISKRVEEELGGSNTLKGTLGFIAPELHGFVQRKDDYAPDLWALGEISFQIFTKLPTFKNLGLLHTYSLNPSTFPTAALRNRRVTDLALDFILALMDPLPDNRMTAQSALIHPWMESYKPAKPSSTPSLEDRRASLGTLFEPLGAWTVYTSSSDPQIQKQDPTIQPTQDRLSRLEIADPQMRTIKLISGPSEEASSKHDPPDQSTQPTAVPPVQLHEERCPIPRPLPPSGDSTTIQRLSTEDQLRKPSFWMRALRLNNNNTQKRTDLIRKLEGHYDRVSSVAFSPDGSTIASGCPSDTMVRLWDAAKGRQLRKLDENGGVCSVAFSPDGRTIASGDGVWGTVRLWDAATGRQLRKLQYMNGRVSSVAFSPDGRTIASGGHGIGWTMRLWDAATNWQWRQLDGHSDEVSSVAFSPDGRTIASGGSSDGTVRLWEGATGRQLWKLEGHSGGVSSVAFSPDGGTIASGGHDNDWTVRLWEAATGRQLWMLEGHSGGVSSMAFSPDGGTIASGGYHDETVRLWEAATGQQLRKLEGHSGGVSSVAFSPDGGTIASGGAYDGTVRLWDIREQPPPHPPPDARAFPLYVKVFSKITNQLLTN